MSTTICYSVRIIGYGGVAEEIFDDPVLRKQYPDYSHRILHLFRAELMSETREKASETDFSMQECQWIDLNEVQALSELVPHQLTEVLPELLNGNTPIYLGTIRYDWIAP